VERWVQPLKRWVTLLSDYSIVKDLARETMEMLEVSEVMKQVRGLVSSRTVIRLNVRWRCSRRTFGLIW
jgi:hypothetical protein